MAIIAPPGGPLSDGRLDGSAPSDCTIQILGGGWLNKLFPCPFAELNGVLKDIKN